jgi:protocatechuate 3,4-dioxygenase beta subunit
MDKVEMTRRRLLELGLAVPPVAALLTSGCTFLGAGAKEEAATLPATPACDDGDETPSQSEGPFFTPGSPRRRSLVEPGMPGTRLTVTGRVLTSRCEPVPRALLDFWQADANGVYDNEGDRLRGHQFTDGRGSFRLETVVPGLYSGRTRHIHVKAQAPNEPVLTTQLYFPGEPANEDDGLFDPRLLVRWRSAGDARIAQFDFVLERVS